MCLDDHLQNTIGGGKEKLWHYFKEVKQDWPTGPYIEYAYPSLAFNKTQQEDMIDLIQTCKNDMFWELIRQKNAIQCRPGFLSLLDELTMQSKDQLKVGICSASTKSSFLRLMYVLLGDQRMKSIDLTIVGDDCPEKKPSPMIYEMASKQLGIPPSRCLVVEDSLIGLRAAKAAGMK